MTADLPCRRTASLTSQIPDRAEYVVGELGRIHADADREVLAVHDDLEQSGEQEVGAGE